MRCNRILTSGLRGLHNKEATCRWSQLEMRLPLRKPDSEWKPLIRLERLLGGNWSTLSAQPVRWMRKEVCVYSIHVCGRIQERETMPVTELASSSCIQQDSELLIFMSTHLYNKHTMFVKSLVGQSFPPPSFPASYYSLLPVPPSRDHSHFPSHWVTYTHFLLFFFFFLSLTWLMFLSDSQQCVVAAGHVAANLTDWKSILVDHKAGLVLGFL